MPKSIQTKTPPRSQPVELPPELLSRISGGNSAIELGERVAAFILHHMM